MMAERYRVLVGAVQGNCDIADARHAQEATMCTYLLQMREFHCWERGLPPEAQPARAEVSRWIADREAAWQSLEDAEFAQVGVARLHQPFDAAALNGELVPQGLVYGAGYGRFHRPHFFLAELEHDGMRDGIRVLVAGRELARGLAAMPAALQGNTIYVRRESLRTWLREKVDFWRTRRTAGALARAIECWGLAPGDESGFERVVDAEIETVKLHVRKILSKLKLSSRVEAAVFAVEHRVASERRQTQS